MTEKVSILGFAGSLRQGSYNRALLNYAREHLPDGHDVYGAMMFGLPKYKYRRIPQRHEASVEWR